MLITNQSIEFENMLSYWSTTFR